MDADLGELGRRRRRGNGGAEFAPAALFANSEQGLWYDPSDLTTEKTSWRRNLLTYSQDFENAAWTKTNASLLSNLALYSQEFDNAAWVKTAATVTANTATAPDGTTTADKLIATAVLGQHRVDQTPVSSAGTQTLSCYAKASEYGFVWLRIGLNGAVFSLSDGTTSSVSANTTATATSVGSGWWRCVLTTTVALANDVCRINVLSSSSQSDYTGDGTSGIFIWGAQLVVGSTAQTYTRSLATAAPIQFSDPLGGTMAEKYVPASTFGLTVNLASGCPLRRTSAISGIAAGYAVSFSTYAKAAEYNRITLYVDDGLIAKSCVVSLVDGSVVSVSTNATCNVTTIGNGWYRINLVYTFTSGGTASGFRIAPQDSVATTGDGVSGIYVFGAQAEQASTASAYQRITDFNSDFLAAFPTHALYQESTFLTPVTALGQSVGGVVDKRLGGLAALGPELVTNGDFASGTTGWTDISGSWSIVDGQLFGSNITANAFGPYQNATTPVAGRMYQATFSLTVISGGLIVRVGNQQSATYSTSGTYTVLLVAATTGVTLFQVRAGGSGFTGSIDNVSVREVPGNHAIQATSASRPTVQARANLLTYSEQFDNAAWNVIGSVTTTANAIAAPDGTTTADLITASAAGPASAGKGQTVTFTGDGEKTFSVYLKVGDGSVSTVAVFDSTAATMRHQVRVTWTAGVPSLTSLVGAGTLFPVQSVGDGWYRIAISATGVVAANSNSVRVYVNNVAAAVTGNSVYVWGAQAENATIASTYQRVVTATDYADVGLPRNLLFDGIDDSLATVGNVDFATWTGSEARRNLLTMPTMFDDAAWTNVGTPTVTANTTLAPDGTTTADTINDSSAIESQGRRQTIAIAGGTTTSYVASVYILKTSGTPTIFPIFNLRMTGGTTVDAYIALNTTTGETVTFGSVSGSAVDAGTYWRLTLVAANNGTANTSLLVTVFPAGATTLTTTLNVAATGSQVFWGAQLETGSTATAFQNVGTDKVSVFSGVTKNSDVAAGLVYELTASIATNNGAFAMLAPSSASGFNARFLSKGTTSREADAASLVAPVTRILTGLGNIGGDSCAIRDNGVQTAIDTGDQGTGTYSSATLYVGRRGGTANPFSGRIFQLIVRGAATDSVTVTNAEQYVAQKTGVTL